MILTCGSFFVNSMSTLLRYTETMASIRERPSTTGEPAWAVLYRHQTKQRSMTFESEKSAVNFKKLIDVLGPDRALATLEAAEKNGPTVDELAETFFEWKGRDITPRTMADYRRDYANWIRPRLGHRYANSVDERDVQQLVDAMASQLEPKSVADRHMIMHSMFKFGVAKSRRLVDHNPCLETQLPTRKKKPPKGVTLKEWQALHSAAKEVEPDAADLIMFIAATGWRWSEAAALTVGSVEEYANDADPSAERMYVSMRAVMRNAQVVDDAAKSGAGFRRIKLPATAADVVRRRMVGKGPGDLVFTNAAGRKWYQQNFLNRTWTRIVEASKLDRRPTPHMLRHTHVALLDRAGVSLPEMQRRLGHEDIQTTINVYGGMIDDISDTALAALDRMLSAAPPRTGDVVAGSVVLRELG